MKKLKRGGQLLNADKGKMKKLVAVRVHDSLFRLLMFESRKFALSLVELTRKKLERPYNGGK